jgi:RNA polymerase sigma-70 factor (TIGR02943 family)
MTAKKYDLSEWVETYAQDMFRWALFKLSDEELAKDIVQDTFLAAAEKLDGFEGKSTPKTWLFSILNFKIIDLYRKRAKSPDTVRQSFMDFFDEDGDWFVNRRPKAWDHEETNLLDDHDFQLVLKKCLEALPEKWNACVKLKYFLDKSGEDICQELEITPTNFWQIMHRTKLNLRECIDGNWFQN